MVDGSSLKQRPCFQETNFWQIAEAIPLCFSSVRQEMGMVDPLSGGWQLHKKTDGTWQAISRRWSLWSRKQGCLNDYGESSCFWTGWIKYSFDRRQHPFTDYQLSCLLCDSLISQRLYYELWNISLMFDLCNTHCLYLVLTRTICFALSVCALPLICSLHHVKDPPHRSHHNSSPCAMIQVSTTKWAIPLFAVSYKSFKITKKLFSENTWNLKRGLLMTAFEILFSHLENVIECLQKLRAASVRKGLSPGS